MALNLHQRTLNQYRVGGDEVLAGDDESKGVDSVGSIIQHQLIIEYFL